MGLTADEMFEELGWTNHYEETNSNGEAYAFVYDKGVYNEPPYIRFHYDRKTFWGYDFYDDAIEIDEPLLRAINQKVKELKEEGKW